MKVFLVRAATVAAVAVAVAQGFGLKGAIDSDVATPQEVDMPFVQDFEELVGLRNLKGRPKDCAPVNPSTERRVCPNTGAYRDPVECRNCITRCSVKGDPHLSTWYSSCTQVVGNKPGKYLMWYVPARAPRAEINITVVVEQIISRKALPGYRRRHWITEVWKNGEQMLTRDACKEERGHENVVNVTGTIKTWSDITLDKGNKKAEHKDVEVRYRFGCREWGDSRGVRQLLVELELHDEVDGLKEVIPSDVMPPPTTQMFHNDEGMCNDPVVFGQPGGKKDLRARSKKYRQYNLACHRRAEFSGDLEGRMCKCDATCGAWGDPHINAFHKRPCRKSSGRCQDLMPVKPGDYIPENILYSKDQMVAYRLEVDPRCHMIVKVHAYFMKPEYQEKWLGCTPESHSPAMLSSFPYDYDSEDGAWEKVTLSSQDMCKSFGRGKATTLEVPSADHGSKYMSTGPDGKTGFKLGTYGIHVNPNTAEQTFVPLGYGKNVATADSKCVNKQGYQATDFAKKVDMGMVSLVADCHKTKGGIFYFNVCVNARDMAVTHFVVKNPQFETMADLPRVNFTYGHNLFQSIERTMKTSGWCATGKILKQSTNNVFAENQFHTRKENGTVELFELVARQSVLNTGKKQG
jgi:hypothetical protein